MNKNERKIKESGKKLRKKKKTGNMTNTQNKDTS